MKKLRLIIILLGGALVGCACPIEPTGVRCSSTDWSPEQYRFYGAKDTIIEKLANIPAKFSERRFFLQVTQGDSRADVKLYERQKDGNFTVTEWTPKQTSRLLAKIDEAIMANKGVNCIGEQIKGVLSEELKEGRVYKDVAVPASPRAAFAHSIKQASGKFIKSTIFLGC